MSVFDPVADYGMGLDDLAATAHTVYLRSCEALGYTPLRIACEFDQLGDVFVRAWMQVVGEAHNCVVTGVEATVGDLARRFYNVWANCQKLYGDVAFDDLSLPAKVAWEAVARHMCYMLTDREKNESVDYDGWARWAKERHAAIVKKDYEV